MTQTPALSLRQRFAKAYRWRGIRFLLVVNIAIGFFSFIASIGDGTELWRRALLSQLFAHTIGNTIYLLCIISDFAERWRLPLRALVLLATFVFGGWLGTLLASLLAAAFFGLPFSGQRLEAMVEVNTVVFVILCFLIWAFVALYDQLQDTAARLAEKEVAEQRLLRLKGQAELESLRARVNPHFLFNTLNSIASLIPVDPGRAEGMVQGLSRLFRYTLDVGQRPTVRLEEEIGAVRQYLDIEKVRLGERLEYHIDVAEGLSRLQLPGLILQPLVENSVKHGIAPLTGGGRIEVVCRQEGDRVRIEVRDNGGGLEIASQAEGAGFGLRSVRERLALHYGAGHDFALKEEGGVAAVLKLPIQGRGDDG